MVADQDSGVFDKTTLHTKPSEDLLGHRGAENRVIIIMGNTVFVHRARQRLSDIMEEHDGTQKRIRLDILDRRYGMTIDVAIMVLIILFKIEGADQFGDKDGKYRTITPEDKIDVLAAQELQQLGTDTLICDRR